MNRRIDSIIAQWMNSRIETIELIDEGDEFQMDLNNSPYKLYLHSLTPQLITMISLIKLKRYPDDDIPNKINQMIKCLKIIKMSQWSINNGVLLYLQILKNKLGRLINLMVKFQQILNGQFHNLVASVISGYIRRFQIELGSTIVVNDNDWSFLSIIEIIKSCILNKSNGTLKVLFPTKILLIIKTVDDLMEFIEINLKNCKYNVNLFNDWRLEEMNDNLNKIQMNLRNNDFNDLKPGLNSLISRYDTLSESNDDIRKQFKISSPTINEKRRSSGLKFSLVKVYNEN